MRRALKLRDDGWTIRFDSGWLLVATHPGCPACHGSGLDTREAARLVLDAEPRIDRYAVIHNQNVDNARAAGSPWYPAKLAESTSGDQSARDHLSILADRLQGEGWGTTPDVAVYQSVQSVRRDGLTTPVPPCGWMAPGKEPYLDERRMQWVHTFVDGRLRGEWLALWLVGRDEWVLDGEAALERAAARAEARISRSDARATALG
jgi:hypothetical protein